jgi:hypothetical protein
VFACHPNGLASSDYFPHHAAVHVGKAKIAPGITIGKTFVIEAEQIKDGGVKIVNVHRIFSHMHPEVI